VEMPRRKRVCIVVSSIGTAEAFLLNHILRMTAVYDVTVVANCREKMRLRRRGVGADVYYAPLVRRVAPFRDLWCLLRLAALFRRCRFDAVHSVTPKAGLLGMLAAVLARVPVRVHTFTGQVWATRSGLSRAVLRVLDSITAFCATNVLVDSRSQLEFLVWEGVVTEPKALVLANGSISGVDPVRFRFDPVARRATRASMGVPDNATVFVYVGRLKREKGVLDLGAAFSRLGSSGKEAYMVFVGVDEENIKGQIERGCASCGERLRFIDWTDAPERYMGSADVLCLPSYREGFGSVVIEAAACGVPALASRIYGIMDAVVDGATGVLHKPGDPEDIVRWMRVLIDAPRVRAAMGERARVRAHCDFAQEGVTSALMNFYSTAI
jgi:glycosyltransferase involved in cell wall biosynthesis